jgi:hypothetical protein
MCVFLGGGRDAHKEIMKRISQQAGFDGGGHEDGQTPLKMPRLVGKCLEEQEKAQMMQTCKMSRLA